MMKNEKGITLLVLTITIIILLILLAVGLQLTYTGVNSSLDSKLQAELGIVRQAITEKYTQAVAVNKNKSYANDAEGTEFFVGDMIDPSDILTTANLTDYTSTSSNSIACLRAFTEYSRKVCTYKEDYYYYIDRDDLDDLEVDDTLSEYIVNYKTGEVFNVKEKKNNGELFYLPPAYTEEDDKDDTGVFNDWVE